MTDLEQLRAFAQDILDFWPDGNADGDDVQSLAVKHGLLRPVSMPEPCGESCYCAEFYSPDEWPVNCFRKTPLVTGEELTVPVECPSCGLVRKHRLDCPHDGNL